MDSSSQYLPIAEDLAGIRPKRCSQAPATVPEVELPPSRNATGLLRIANALKASPQLSLEEKQLVLELAAGLMSGDLTAVRRVTDRLHSNVRRLAMLRDVLASVLPTAGQNAVQLIPGEVFNAQLAPGKTVEAVYVTLRCMRTNEAIGIPSHMSLPVQVFRLMSMGTTENRLLQPDERADPAMVFRRISGLMVHSDIMAPPPPWQSASC